MSSENITRGKKVLVVGSGGRCHAIVDGLARSPRVGKIFCAPGNGGITEMAECVDISVTDVKELVEFASYHGVDMVVIGPEASLEAGLADGLIEAGIPVFGPTRAGARIESSKEFAKQLMMRHAIPTAGYQAFDDFDAALAYIKSRPLPAVIKYDGLAAGKGVVVAITMEEAEKALGDMLLDSAFGQGRVVVEDFLEGPEFSFMCVVSGRKVYPLAIAQDHKRAFDGDKGPNTGGMGAYSPVPFVTPEIEHEALEKIMQPVADALAEEGIPYTGVLYGGLILTKEGPKVIEFNARFGDPETEVVLPRLESDLYTLFESALEQKDYPLEWSDDYCLGVVLAAEGYPESYAKGINLGKLDIPGVWHMGTRRDGDRYISAGGRVIMVTGRGATLAEANANALENVAKADAEGLFHRTDIGHHSL
ncbi:MAG: phosphoribosylamine--glycine ligase [Muribaculaceae bacterium]|nr:phosphoribosylamine--glycine ligase [Muribaculaceae bacterium]